MSYRVVKRILDICFSALALLVLLPLFVLIGLVVCLDSPGSPIFAQERAGQHKKSIRVYKFRTMYRDTPENVPTGERERPYDGITRVGRFLRRSSLDELPQLFNILKGEMSFVGPRPLIWAETEIIEARDRLGVYEVRPGLTGWAQVNGRDLVTAVQKEALDAEYVRHMSFWFDVRCLRRTVKVVLCAEGFREGAGAPERTKAKQHERER